MQRNIQKTRAKAKNSRSNQQKKKNFEKIRQRNRKIASIIAWIIALAVFVLTITYAQVKLQEKFENFENEEVVFFIEKVLFWNSRLEERWFGGYRIIYL